MDPTSISSTEPRRAAAEPMSGGLRLGFAADDLYPGFGGQAVATEGHITALLARGHRVRALAGRSTMPADPPAGVELRRLAAWQPGDTQTEFAWPDPASVRWLVGWAQVVHVNTPTPLGLAVGLAARAVGRPCVMGFHTQLESSSLHFERIRPFVEASVAAWFKAVYTAADALAAPTEFAAGVARRFTRKPIHVVSNGVRRPEDAPSREAARAGLEPQLRPRPAERVLLYVGRLAPEKRPGDLFPVVARLPQVVLWVVGSGPLTEELRAEADALGLGERVRFLGFVPDEQKTRLIAAADLFVMPSPTELQSIATLEAMAHGRAVAAADYATSAVPGLVTAAGAGIAYPPGDPEAAAAEIAELLDDAPRMQAYESAARAATAEHTVERSAEALEAVYRGLLA